MVKEKVKIVHFVCRGNKFRSRIAETITNSKDCGVRAISSGIEPDLSTEISPWASYVLKINGLVPSKQHPRLTTRRLLEQSNLVVVMSEDVYIDAPYLESYKPIIWNVQDIDRRVKADLADLNSPLLQEAANTVFFEIYTNITKLLDELIIKKS